MCGDSDNILMPHEWIEFSFVCWLSKQQHCLSGNVSDLFMEIGMIIRQPVFIWVDMLMHGAKSSNDKKNYGENKCKLTKWNGL